MTSPKRPNILLLMADQMRFDCLGRDNPAIKTPNLDRLADSGVQCTHAYPPTPVCLPCRASVSTGQFPSTHGATHNHTMLDPHYPQLLGQIFRDAGYWTHFIGKSHLSNCHDNLGPEGPHQIHHRDFYRAWHGPWYGFEHADLAVGHTTEKHACSMHYGAWLEDQGCDLDRYFGNTEYTEYGAWELPEQWHNSRWTADTVIKAIDGAQRQDQPFLINANFQDPHNPCMVPEPWASMYDPEQIPRYGFQAGEPACFADKPRFYQEILDQPGDYACVPSDPDLGGAGNVCHLDWSQEQIQANAAAYYGMITLMDEHIGRILDHLEAIGERENTLIVFCADHGELLGDHGLWFKSMVPYDESIRVPFLVSQPGVIPANKQSASFVNLVDLMPSFCAHAGIATPIKAEGNNCLPAWENPEHFVATDTFVEERPSDSEWNQRILVEAEWKCVFYANRDEGELYHTSKDPHLTENLWNTPEHSVKKQAMLSRILSHEMNKSRPTPSPCKPNTPFLPGFPTA